MSARSHSYILWGTILGMVAIIVAIVAVIVFSGPDKADPFMPPRGVIVDAVKGEFQRYCQNVEDRHLDRIESMQGKQLPLPPEVVFCRHQWLVPDTAAVWWGINPASITYTRTRVAEPNAFVDVAYDAWILTEPLAKGLEPKLEKMHCKRSIFLARQSDGWHYQGTNQPITPKEF